MGLLTDIQNHESNKYRYLLGRGGSDDCGSEDQELPQICQTSDHFVETPRRDSYESLDVYSIVESPTMGILFHWFPGLDLGTTIFGSQADFRTLLISLASH